MQTLCCNRPHYVESSNAQNVYCVNCGTAKPLVSIYSAYQPVWIAPYYQPYNPYQPYWDMTPRVICGTDAALTNGGGSINITSSIT